MLTRTAVSTTRGIVLAVTVVALTSLGVSLAPPAHAGPLPGQCVFGGGQINEVAGFTVCIGGLFNGKELN